MNLLAEKLNAVVQIIAHARSLVYRIGVVTESYKSLS